MAIFKNIILVIFLYFLAILQSSFLVHFGFFAFFPNFIAILAILWNLFEKEKKIISSGLLISVMGGFFLDVFSSRIIGFYILILVGIAIFIKIIIRKNVRVPISESV